MPPTLREELFKTQGTFEAWVWPNATFPLTFHPIFAKDKSFGFGLFSDTSAKHSVAFFFGDLDSGAWKTVPSVSTPSVSNDGWTHIALSFNVTIITNITGAAAAYSMTHRRSQEALFQPNAGSDDEADRPLAYQSQQGNQRSRPLYKSSSSSPSSLSTSSSSKTQRFQPRDILDMYIDVVAFVNGQLSGFESFPLTPNFVIPESPLYLWRHYFTVGNQSSTPIIEPWAGNLAEVRIWDAAMDQQAVQSSMGRTLQSQTPNLTAYWPTNDCQGGYVEGFSPDQLTSTIISGAWDPGAWPPVNFSCPNDCSQHAAECTADGVCVCDAGWDGPDCSLPDCRPSCVHGVCIGGAAGCLCDDYWAGPGCEGISVEKNGTVLPPNTTCSSFAIAEGAFVYLGGPLTVAGNATVEGWIFPAPGLSALSLQVLSALVVAPSGGISVSSTSFYRALPAIYPSAGSYGGCALNQTCPARISCTNEVYGDFRAPSFPGAAGIGSKADRDPAGGQITIDVYSLVCDGAIEADGVGTASGGSVFIRFHSFGNETQATFSGAGIISASNLPIPGEQISGSGGRVSLTGFIADGDASSVPSMFATATFNSAPGTIFLQNQILLPFVSLLQPGGISSPTSTLVISQTLPRLPPYPTALPAMDYGVIDDLVISNALFMIEPPGVLNVSGICYIEAGSSVNFTGLHCASIPPAGGSTTAATSTLAPTSTQTFTTTRTSGPKIQPTALIEMIIASVFGFLILLAFVLLGVWFWRKSRKSRKQHAGYTALNNTPGFDYMTYSNPGDKQHHQAINGSSSGIRIPSQSRLAAPLMGVSSSQRGSLESPAGPYNSAPSYRKLEAFSGENFENALSGYEIDFKELQIIHPPIAKGGFGVVNRALYKGTNVAVKTLFEHLGELPLEEFCREIRALGRIHHPNIVLLMGACRDPLCIVTEFVERGSLFDVIHRHPEDLTPRNIVQIVQGAVCGLAFLHAQVPPILHRDLKSANILITKNYEAKIADFGLSRQMSALSSVYSQSLTKRIGTTRWTAPEVLIGGNYTEKSDVYSFGMILYEIFSGNVPFFEEMWDSKVEEQIVAGTRPDIPQSTPPMFEEIMRACWITPAERPSFSNIASTLA